MEPPLTDKELADIRKLVAQADQIHEMRIAWDRSTWAARAVWKTSIWVGAAIAGFLAFKDNLAKLLGK